MRTDEFDYQLPQAQIAQRPLPERDASRLLLLDRSTGAIADSTFAQFPDLLRGDELLVFNNARVLPARLFGKRAGVHSQPPSRATAREHLSGTVEVFLTRHVSDHVWEALVRPGRKLRVGERIVFGAVELEAEIVARGEFRDCRRDQESAPQARRTRKDKPRQATSKTTSAKKDTLVFRGCVPITDV